MIWYGTMEAKWDQERLEKIIMVAWIVWTDWNRTRCGKPKRMCQQVVFGAMEYLSEYQECVHKENGPSPITQAHWSPPLADMFKTNVDGAIFAHQKSAGIGMVIRDSVGRIIGACSKKIQAPLDAMEAEAKAVEFGLHFVRDMMIQEFVLESDSLTVINALKETSPPPFLIAVVVYGSLSDSHDFRQVVFSHVCRQANKPAHLLAKYALGIDDFSVWLEKCPCFLEQALLNDVLLISSFQ